MVDQTELRQRKQDKVSALLQEELLDTAEQEELLLEFRKLHAQDTRQWQLLSVVMGTLLALVYVLFSMYQVVRAADPRVRPLLQDTLGAPVIVLGEWLSAASILAVATAMYLGPPSSSSVGSSIQEQQRARAAVGTAQHPSKRAMHHLANRLFGWGTLGSVSMAVMWSVASAVAVLLSKLQLGDVWRVSWLYICPVLYVWFSRHVLASLQVTATEINKLQRQMYRHTKA